MYRLRLLSSPGCADPIRVPGVARVNETAKPALIFLALALGAAFYFDLLPDPRIEYAKRSRVQVQRVAEPQSTPVPADSRVTVSRPRGQSSENSQARKQYTWDALPPMFLIGLACIMAGSLWSLIEAFVESLGWGLLVLFTNMLGAFLFACVCPERGFKPFGLQLLGIAGAWAGITFAT